MILIQIKKFKKFEIDWYESYEIVQKKILNIYILKFFENSFNKYLINDDRMKLIYINKTILKDWHMFKNWKKLHKHALLKNDKNKIKKKRERSRKQTEFHLNVEYKFILNDDFKKKCKLNDIKSFKKKKNVIEIFKNLYKTISRMKSFLCCFSL